MGERLRTPFDKALRASQQRQDTKSLLFSGGGQISEPLNHGSTVSGNFYRQSEDPFRNSMSNGFSKIEAGYPNRKEAI